LFTIYSLLLKYFINIAESQGLEAGSSSSSSIVGRMPVADEEMLQHRMQLPGKSKTYLLHTAINFTKAAYNVLECHIVYAR